MSTHKCTPCPRVMAHLGRARLLLDLLIDQQRGATLEATLRVIADELASAVALMI